MPKTKMMIKKFGKMNLIFEFSTSKLGYLTVFMKIWEEKVSLFFKRFLTNRDKNKNKDEKIWKNKFEFFI